MEKKRSIQFLLTWDINRRFALWKSVEKMAESFSGLLDDVHSRFLHPAFFRMPCRISESLHSHCHSHSCRNPPMPVSSPGWFLAIFRSRLQKKIWWVRYKLWPVWEVRCLRISYITSLSHSNPFIFCVEPWGKREKAEPRKREKAEP